MNDSDRFVTVDGVIMESNEPAVSVNSRGLMYGDGCFETFCVYTGRSFKLKEHIKRLRSGLDFLQIEYPQELEIEKVWPKIYELLNRNNLHQTKAIVRLQVWRQGGRGYSTESVASHYSIMCSKLNKPDTNSYRLATVDVKRIPSISLPSQYKFANGLNYITAANQAKHKEADDALMTTVDGWISETTIANIFWLKEDVVFTPSEACDILPGITRRIILGLLKNQLNIAVKEGTFGMDEIKKAELVFICNSVKEIVPIAGIDETQFDTRHPLLEKMQSCFKAYRNRQLSAEV